MINTKHLQLSPSFQRRAGIRSERHSDFIERFNITAIVNGCDAKILNISESGICIAQNIDNLEIDHIVNIEITFKNETLLSSKSKVIWVKNKKGLNEFGLIFLDNYLGSGLLDFLVEGSQLASKIQRNEEKYFTLPETFRTHVQDLRYYLNFAKKELDSIELRNRIENPENVNSLKRALRLSLFDEVKDKILQYSAAFNEEYRQDCNPDLKRLMQDYFRTELGELLASSPFTQRALAKPRGYAGDFEMMMQIYRHQPEGSSIFASLIHYWSIQEPSADSVRFRRSYFADKFKDLIESKSNRKVMISSIACGPSKEIQDFLNIIEPNAASQLCLLLIDQDQEALRESKRRISEICINRGIHPELYFLPISVKEILEGDLASLLGGQKLDMIYSAGLYDYLPQPIAKNLTKVLWDSLGANSSLFLGNFSRILPSRAILELGADWHLIYRNEEEMLDLRPINCSKYEVEADSEKMQLILRLTS